MYSYWIVVAAFLVGCAVGGLLVSLRRRLALERLRQEFQRQLEHLADQHRAEATEGEGFVPRSGDQRGFDA